MTTKLDPYLTFLVGYNTAYVGVPFRAAHLLSAERVTSGPERQRLIDEQIAKLRDNNHETIWFVAGTNELLGNAGLYEPAKPHDFYGWYTWAHDARRVVAVMNQASSPLVRAMVAGQAYGTFAAAVVLDEILLITRDAVLPSLVDVTIHSEAEAEIVNVSGQLELASVEQPQQFVHVAQDLVGAARRLPPLTQPVERLQAVHDLVLRTSSYNAGLTETFRAEADRYRGAPMA